MKHTNHPTAFMLAIAILLSSIGLMNQSKATDTATRLVPGKPSATIQDNLVNPVGCRHCRTIPCTCCEPVCCPKRVEDKEEKSCWKVACEYVCVPGFRFPWEKCCGPVCGWVRCVNVLEEHKYECDTCGYEWEVKCVFSSQGNSRHHCKCPRCQRDCR